MFSKKQCVRCLTQDAHVVFLEKQIERLQEHNDQLIKKIVSLSNPQFLPYFADQEIKSDPNYYGGGSDTFSVRDRFGQEFFVNEEDFKNIKNK